MAFGIGTSYSRGSYSGSPQPVIDQAQTALARQPRTGQPSGMLGSVIGQVRDQTLAALPPGQAEGQMSGALGGTSGLPTNTRSTALQQVQQAYQTPTSYSPGQGLGMYMGDFLSNMSKPASASDPHLSGAIAAGRIADQRNSERQRAALAERLGSQGLGSSGAMETGKIGIDQAIGERAAMRESGLVLDEQNARRQALLSALGLDQNRYQFDQDAGIRLLLAELQGNQMAMQPFFG